MEYTVTWLYDTLAAEGIGQIWIPEESRRRCQTADSNAPTVRVGEVWATIKALYGYPLFFGDACWPKRAERAIDWVWKHVGHRGGKGEVVERRRMTLLEPLGLTCYHVLQTNLLQAACGL